MLKGVADGSIRVHPHKQVIGTGDKDKLPSLWGDVIAQTIGGRSGFIYFNGGKYAWYDQHSAKAVRASTDWPRQGYAVDPGWYPTRKSFRP